jgi:hypothetical protein
VEVQLHSFFNSTKSGSGQLHASSVVSEASSFRYPTKSGWGDGTLRRRETTIFAFHLKTKSHPSLGNARVILVSEEKCPIVSVTTKTQNLKNTVLESENDGFCNGEAAAYEKNNWQQGER